MGDRSLWVRTEVVVGDETMMKRLLVALGTAVLFAGPTFAEEPAAAPSPASAPDAKPVQAPEGKPALIPGGCCAVGGACDGAGPQFWATADYLFAWFSGDRLPALVTTSPAGTAQAIA